VKRVLCVLLLSCGPVDVVVADVPKACTTKDDCHPGDVCDYGHCDDAYGVCRPPTMCTGTELPECGCDNVRYANPCLREQAGVSRGPGPC
jgi:hypothetical protein